MPKRTKPQDAYYALGDGHYLYAPKDVPLDLAKFKVLIDKIATSLQELKTTLKADVDSFDASIKAVDAKKESLFTKYTKERNERPPADPKPVDAPIRKSAEDVALEASKRIKVNTTKAGFIGYGETAEMRADKLSMPEGTQTKSTDPDVEKRWKGARGLGKAKFLSSVDKAIVGTVHSFTRHYP